MKITKNRYLAAFSTVVILLAIVRLFNPEIGHDASVNSEEASVNSEELRVNSYDLSQDEATSTKGNHNSSPITLHSSQKNHHSSQKNHHSSQKSNHNSPLSTLHSPLKKGEPPHPIYGVSSYTNAFPDSQQVQIVAANKWGVSPVKNRKDAEERKRELVFMGACPYYHVDRMHRSIPYLVPRAAVLLNDMGRAFYDSLQMKGLPMHQFIVSSVLRTQEDVQKLRNYNGNATENSCHLYGTTFDIAYNRYHTVQAPGEKRRAVRNDSLKYVLCEVLRDMRREGRCYVKYEVKQGCFHITTR